MPAKCLFLSAFLLLPFTTAVAEDQGQAEDASNNEAVGKEPNPWLVGMRGKEKMIISTGRLYESDGPDDTLRGLRFATGPWSDDVNPRGRYFYFLTAMEREDQRILGAGLNIGVTVLRPGPVRIVPNVTIGGEQWFPSRGEDYEGPVGLNLILGAGLETAIWIKDKIQVAWALDRVAVLPSGARTQILLELRFAVD